MRVPGNERAFTVSPARGIPFPQLVCIGAAAGQSQAFPVSARARLAAAGSWNWPARPRCRCALLYAARVERPRPPRLPASPRIHAHTLTGSHAPRGSAPLRTAALRLSLHTRAVARPWAPGCSAQRHQWRPRSGDRGSGGRSRRPAGPGRTQARNGSGAETSQRETPRAPWRCTGCRKASGARVGAPRRPPTAEPPLPRRGCDATARGDGGPRARRKSSSAGPQASVGSGVALIHLMRPDGSRSPQHSFCVFSFLSWLVFFNWCYSPCLGCALITQRASLRPSVLSGEPRGLQVRRPPQRTCD